MVLRDYAIIESVLLACERAARLVRLEASRGQATLAAIASSSVFTGVFATLIGIATSFRGLGTEKTTAMAFLTALLGHALVPTAGSIFIALFAAWGHSYIRRQVEQIDWQARSASLELANTLCLALRQGRFS